MKRTNIHILHVGDMTNKGTEALIRSDVTTLHQIIHDASITVSTTDIEGVNDIGMDCEAMPVLIDIPYTLADRIGGPNLSRGSLRYKLIAGLALVYVLIQTVLLFISAFFMKIGLSPFYRPKLMKRIKECDVIISGSDENFKEAASLLPLNIYWKITWWSILFNRTMEMVVVKYLRKPTILFPNSIGPFRSSFGKFLARKVFNSFDMIIIREPVSWEILHSLKIDKPKKLTSDAALLFKPRGEPPSDITTEPTLCVCPGVYNQALSDEELDNYINSHALALDYAVQEFNLDIVLMPHFITGFELDDLGISKLIQDRMQNKKKVKIIVVEDLDEFKHRLNNMTMLITSKMHPGVLGVSSYVPTLCVAYDHKQIGFFNNLEMPECLVDINKISTEKLIETLDYIWNNKESIKTELQERIPKLQKEIRDAMEQGLFSLIKNKSEN